MDSCSQWWWADYTIHGQRNGYRNILDLAHPDLHRNTIYKYVEVAQLFAPEDRHPGLSFSHHQAIRYILGPDAILKEAKKWLVRASVSDWTVGELREAMRKDGRKGENDPGPMRGHLSFVEFIKCSRLVENLKVSEIDEDQRDDLKKTTEPLFSFLCELHRKPFGINNS